MNLPKKSDETDAGRYNFDYIWRHDYKSGEKGSGSPERFSGEVCRRCCSNVHLLPMYPFTSDDGFSVTDYREINPDLGTWKDVKLLSEKYGLMFDAVINHISRSSRWFKKYLEGEAPYTEYFITCDPDEDYSRVTRPRALPLLTKVGNSGGQTPCVDYFQYRSDRS